MSATLGGYIKDLRLQKNISQLEIAFALGWKEPSRLSRIEQGKVENPPRELINKLIDAMHLSEEEKNQLLVVGNYLPTKEEILEARKKIDPILNSWPYPASSRDYTWRIISTNQKLYEALGIPPQGQKEIEEKLPSIIEVVFDPNFPLNKVKTPQDEKERREFMLRMLRQFRYAQRIRTHENWYKNLLQKMMSNNLFRELWLEIQSNSENKSDIVDFSNKTLELRDGKHLNFYFFIMPIFGDPRFFVELYVPKDIETYKYFNN